MSRSTRGGILFFVQSLFYGRRALHGDRFNLHSVWLRIRPEVKAIVDRMPEILLAAQIAFRGLDGCVTQQELNLLQFATDGVAQLRAGSPQLVGCNVLQPRLLLSECVLGRPLNRFLRNRDRAISSSSRPALWSTQLPGCGGSSGMNMGIRVKSRYEPERATKVGWTNNVMKVEARRVAGSGRFVFCIPGGPSPGPRTVGVDLQQCIVQLQRFRFLGEGDAGYGVFV
jgi:hypothetical protein